MYPPIFLLGPSAAGKSRAADIITDTLAQNSVNVEFVTSKRILGALVLDHTRGLIPNTDGVIVTERLTLHNPLWADEDTFQAEFHDGWALNLTHSGLITATADAWRQRGNEVVIMTELANGTEKGYGDGREPARQTAGQFIDWMENHGVLDYAIALHVTAPFEQRAEQNRKRPGYIPDSQFAFLYDIDDLTPYEARRFGDRYHRIDNGGIAPKQFDAEVGAFVATMLLPRLRIEGNPPLGPERDFYYSPSRERFHER